MIEVTIYDKLPSMRLCRNDSFSSWGIWRNAALTIDFIRLLSNTRCVKEYSPVENKNDIWQWMYHWVNNVIIGNSYGCHVPSKFWSMTFVSLLWPRLRVLSPLSPHIVRRPMLGMFECVIDNIFKSRNCWKKIKQLSYWLMFKATFYLDSRAHHKACYLVNWTQC